MLFGEERGKDKGVYGKREYRYMNHEAEMMELMKYIESERTKVVHYDRESFRTIKTY